jgi:putative SOS response-associated peptidase YedK
MCGRFTLTTPDLDGLIAYLGAEGDPSLAASYRPRYNIPPTDPHLILRLDDGKRRVVPARWAFGKPGEKPQINARAETAHKIGLFKNAFYDRRCLVPADGFYEWVGGANARRPIWFHAHPGEFLLFGGIIDPYHGGFAILTTSANDDVATVHDRMPVIIPRPDIDRWLGARDVAEIQPLLAPIANGTLVVTPVSPRANSVKNDDPDCIRPADPTLF